MIQGLYSLFISIVCVVSLLLSVSIIAAGIIHVNKQLQQPIACTMEARICADGSYVGRTGPNCEFAKCP